MNAVRSTLAAGIVLLASAPLRAQTTERVSVSSSGAQGDSICGRPSITPDGRFVAFMSKASNLVSGDTNLAQDIFVRDRQTGQTTRASVDSSGVEGNFTSYYPRISADGRFVAFLSSATNLVAGDTNNCLDVFVRDLALGLTTRCSVGSGGIQGNGSSLAPTISADGRWVGFLSYSTNFGPGTSSGSWSNTFIHDRVSGTTQLVSVAIGGGPGNDDSDMPEFSADATRVAFYSYATNLVAGDTNNRSDVFVRDLVSGITTRVGLGLGGAQGNGDSCVPSISADGRVVAFYSMASNLVAGDSNGASDIFLCEVQSGITKRISVGPGGGQVVGISMLPSISADGRFTAYQSFASTLVPGDSNSTDDVFVFDRLTGKNERESTGTVQSNGQSQYPSISADGRWIAFESSATNLVAGDTNASTDIFVRDRGQASSFVPFCHGNGGQVPCPCGNSGVGRPGCENSAATGGALLVASGIASLAADSVVLDASDELPSALSIVLQGDAVVSPAAFGDGLLCAGGSLKRLYVKSASAGALSAPGPGDPSISARSAALGDTLTLGATRICQVYYRDPDPSFCPAPAGSTFNATNALAIAWGD